MKILSLWDEKGGVGKSTLAIMLAGAAHKKGLKVAIFDEDPQGSCRKIASRTNCRFPFPVLTTPPADNAYDLLIIDMAPNTNTAPYGTVIFPYEPSTLSTDTAFPHIATLEAYCHANGARVIEVINRLDLRLADHRLFVKHSPKDTVKIKTRNVITRATNQFTTIFDDSFKNLYGCREARAEINRLLNEALK